MYSAKAAACSDRLNFSLNRALVKDSMSEISTVFGNGGIFIVRMISTGDRDSGSTMAPSKTTLIFRACWRRSQALMPECRLTRTISSDDDGGRSGAHGPYPFLVNGPVQRSNRRTVGPGLPRLFRPSDGDKALTQGA